MFLKKPIAKLERKLKKLAQHSNKGGGVRPKGKIQQTRRKPVDSSRENYENLTAWQRVQLARHTSRPYFLDYIRKVFTDFVELKGDRYFGDDPSMPCGLAKIDGMPCVVIGQQKGRNVKENLLRNFGSPHPEGYRKALRLMHMGEKFHLPIVALIDTPGAYPGIGAEERHIAKAIAVNIQEMMVLRTPIVAAIIGEGGSGGALGIGVADRLLMLENAYYSVISPEGCAAILWKHRKYAPEAAEALKANAFDLYKQGIVDELVPEPFGGAHQDIEATANYLKSALVAALRSIRKLPMEQLLCERYSKFRKIGIFSEERSPPLN
ncbi:Acetyl-coenzyme A carboxylase carboxyl transferase subunit alpha [Candidatus Xiphinematobacter sp. Idaho Grape]|uniref:acetyl-CoA carboxylase carboxyltransferase subunit alpha n=1 Tax=Candidatus Xiphinematobacter sp. Idaho Grape TaxID=1704307 RepID=UPI00070643AF|nr:acetyl-CoA carboxylase carboxyltransferase subunit alpha [Candidatus Xiphinematobacter sp. Idaho Grape]ALJ56941.1 Acetyl-coenzyme A carboxylase carboxyl transferase subunit alpha [Candidatus Xiphinematobacter sp. Idaho Grape]